MTSFAMPSEVAAILTPPERLTTSQWSEKHIYLSAEDTAEPGPYDVGKTPYLREIIDSAGDPDVAEVVFMKSARVGGTTGLNCIIGDSIDNNPRPIMYVQMEKDSAADELTGRVRRMIEQSPRLRRHIPRVSGGKVAKHWCTGDRIVLNSSMIRAAWPTNPKTMVRVTVGLLVVDEIDNIVAEMSLGDFLALVRKRVVTYHRIGRSTIYLNGTPTTPHGPGWRMLGQSDYRTYRVPCPKCREYQHLTMSRLVLDDKEVGRRKTRPTPAAIRRYGLARYQCAHCNAMLRYDEDLRWMIDRGVWVPKGFKTTQKIPKSKFEAARTVQPPGKMQWAPKITIDPDHDGPLPPHDEKGQPLTTTREDVRGYHISALYSPYVTWSNVLAEFFEAKEDPDRLRVFVNQVLGEPFVESESDLTPNELASKKNAASAIPMGWVPSWAKVLFMGVDVQLDHVWYVVRAFGAGGRSAKVSCGKVYPTRRGMGYLPELHNDLDPDAKPRTDLQKVYDLAFSHGFGIRGDGENRRMRVRHIVVDSGASVRRDEVNQFGRRPGVMLCKGQGEAQWKFSSGDPFRMSENIQGLLLINRDNYIGRIHRLARLSEEDPESWNINTDTPEVYLDHITSQVLVREKVKQGRRKGQFSYVWRNRNPGARRDLLDCEVYLHALGDFAGVTGPGTRLREDTPLNPSDLLYPKGSNRPSLPNARTSESRKIKKPKASPKGMFHKKP